MKKSLSFLAILGFAASLSGGVPAFADPSKYDFSGSDEYHLVQCETASELDCVESFGFIDSSGKYVAATGTRKSGGTFSGQNGNQIHGQTTNWSATVDGKTKTAILDVPLQSPKFVIFRNPDGTAHYGASLRPWVDSSDLLNTHVRFKIRTSFLIPQNVQLVAQDSDFSQTSIPGGNAWMFEGRGTPVSNYTSNFDSPDKNNFSAKADVDTSTLHFIIHHGDKDLTRGYWPAECGDKGYTVQAFNSNGAGSPSWNSQTQSLDFAIVSPHTKADGSPNTGFFKLWTSDAFINCKWPGNTLSSAPRLEVRIISDDGETQTSVNEVLHKDGKIFVSASGFHYSKPTIQLIPATDSTPTQESPKLPLPIKSRNLTINCLKGKTVKKVTGTSPKCPAGFKIMK